MLTVVIKTKEQKISRKICYWFGKVTINSSKEESLKTSSPFLFFGGAPHVPTSVWSSGCSIETVECVSSPVLRDTEIGLANVSF